MTWKRTRVDSSPGVKSAALRPPGELGKLFLLNASHKSPRFLQAGALWREVQFSEQRQNLFIE